MTNTRAELERHETILQTLLKGFRELQRLQDQHSQAIVELDAALREAGNATGGSWTLPSPPDTTAPASQNANRQPPIVESWR